MRNSNKNQLYFFLFSLIVFTSCGKKPTGSEPSLLPAAPSNFTITAIDYHTNNLTWVDNSDNEDGFLIERSVSDTLNFIELVNLDPNVITYADTGLQSGETYNYRIKAFNSVGSSSYSNVISTTTLISAVVFSPENISISVGEEADLTIWIRDFQASVFGVSLRISFNSDVVSINDSTGFAVGDFFGTNVVAFILEEESVIYLTVTMTQGQEEVNGSGSLGILTFTGTSPGSTMVDISTSDLYFYDSEGNEITITDLIAETAEILVQ